MKPGFPQKHSRCCRYKICEFHLKVHICAPPSYIFRFHIAMISGSLSHGLLTSPVGVKSAALFSLYEDFTSSAVSSRNACNSTVEARPVQETQSLIYVQLSNSC